ncbi:uncharacterized protein BYT42DRAFT_563627 [Radiomyces spectabilis]|uniref:uncharacterized protein n=1 Tax=Radiomyces spectabilis TaxID=64574 RepID=UPI00221F35B6|nr:uncharacterized protein BYT42DRAFT_563627 [Radiomyces spectabilis]KAI8384775.1 hypothetical protein BYT42DRAFT_563627 [Radiomyces spectabilis]
MSRNTRWFKYGTASAFIVLTILLFLFHARWKQSDLHHLRLRKPVRPQIIHVSPMDQEKFITYLPHSGFHNQRIALINALVLAKATNRTLIMPELNVGAATYWRPSNVLAGRMDTCPDKIKAQGGLSVEGCFDYRKYVPIPVSSMLDVASIRSLGINIMQRRDMHLNYFERYWSIPPQDNESQVLMIDDPVRYSYQIYETAQMPSKLQKFEYRLNLADIQTRPEPFVVFGSLFGSHRLQLLEGSKLAWVRSYLRKELGISHPVVQEKSLDLVSRLGGPAQFAAIHVRQGDGVFKKLLKTTVKRVRETLEHRVQQGEITAAINATIQRLGALSTTQEARQQRLDECLKQQYVHSRLQIIYMATDAKKPREKFAELYNEFACLFTLSDFPDIMEQTTSSVLGFSAEEKYYPHVSHLGSLLFPMIDAEVTSHGSFFVGTPKSTFSTYVQYRNSRFLEFYPQNISHT